MVEAKAALAVKPDSQIAALTMAQVSPSPEEALGVLTNFLSSYPDAAEEFFHTVVEGAQFVCGERVIETQHG